MTKNMEMPNKLAASVVDHLKKGSASILAACTEIAAAFTALEEGAWTEQEFRSFFDKLAEANIGKGSVAFLKTDSKGITTFDGKPKAGVFFQKWRSVVAKVSRPKNLLLPIEPLHMPRYIG